MDHTITPAEMKTLEAQFMAEYGVPGSLLMEHAAQGVADALRRRAPGGCALFLCGPGNNGGDGYAAARLWKQQGGRSVIVELSPDAKGDAGLNRTLALLAEIPIRAASLLHGQLPDCDIIVDALFGTGLSRPVDGPAAVLIHLANESGRPIVAVDIPSGLDGTTGKPTGPRIIASETVTFHRMKPGLLLGEGPRFCGEITVHPILIPIDYGSVSGLACMKPSDLRVYIRPRDMYAHKGTFGRAVILAGAPGMAGAAAFAANACIRTGAGLTTVVCRESILPLIQTLAPGAVCIPLTEDENGLAADALALCREALSTASAALIGPGLGQDEAARQLLTPFLEAKCPVVWDADALNLLASGETVKLKPRDVITPHPGEAARLLACTNAAVTADPLAAARDLRQKWGACTLLKGARTLMTDGRRFAVNRFGTPAMAKGGSGDVLAGIMTGLLAQYPASRPTLLIMQLAALIHGLAGLRAEKLHGEICVTPQHLIDCIRLDDQYLD